jgi:hypothetical protein
MKRLTLILACAAACLASCADRERADNASFASVRKTGFPGMVAAGGGTSGDVLARAQRVTNSTYAGGTPGIAGGSGGNTGGAATGGTVRESGHGPSEGVTAPAGTRLPPGKPDEKGQ